MKEGKGKTQIFKLGGILDVLICLLLFIFSIHKGGFYKEDILFPSFTLCVLGVICVIIKLAINIKDHRVINKSKLATILDMCAILLPIAYFFPVIFKKYASLESSIFETIRYVNFAIIYFIVRSSNNKKMYIYTIITIGIILAITGLDEITYRSIEEVISVISIKYLQESNGRISSTIQYANITALIMLVSSIFLTQRVLENSENILKYKKIKPAVKFSIQITVLLILQSAVILTTSRMHILLLIVSGLAYSCYSLFNKDKKKAISTLILTILPFILVTSIEKYLMTKNYELVYITYILTFIVAATLSVLKYKGVKKGSGIERLNIKLKTLKGKRINKKLLIGIIVVVIFLIVLLVSTPATLVVDNVENEKAETITRSIYKFNKGSSNNLNLKINSSEQSEYLIEIYEVQEDFKKENKILEVSSKEKPTEELERKIEISEETIRLKLILKVIKGKVEFEKLNINGDKIKLSYLFIPDTVAFRTKDTINGDMNNKFRMSYYKDAIKLTKFSPIIGIGGEGFKARYQEVQESPYISSEAHSVPIQILVESGIIGLITYITICVITILMIICMLKKKYSMGIVYMLVFACYIISSMFDLVFSFEIMICIFAVIVGVVVNEYKDKYIMYKDLYKIDNKSIIGMVKIGILSVCAIAIIMVTGYSYNLYIASMIPIPEEPKDITINDTYNLTAHFEEKVKYDKYNISYLSTLSKDYSNHISLLNGAYIRETHNKEVIKKEIDLYTIKQKNIVDNMIEYEFYNKYVLEQTARCYFDNYISYSNIYKQNFKDTEIAYAFYLGYAIKLTDRILEIGPYNKVATDMVRNVYNEYIPDLKKQNKYLMSTNIELIIKDMESKLKEVNNI